MVSFKEVAAEQFSYYRRINWGNINPEYHKILPTFKLHLSVQKGLVYFSFCHKLFVKSFPFYRHARNYNYLNKRYTVLKIMKINSF